MQARRAAAPRGNVRFTGLECSQAHRIGDIVHREGDRDGNNRHARLAFHPGNEVFQRHGLGVEITLRDIAAEVAQTVGRGRALDALDRKSVV